MLTVIYFFGDQDQALITQAVVSGLLLGGVYALISVGLTLIFGVLGIVNFAQGAMLTMAMYIVYALSTTGLPVYAATIVAVPLMFVFGMIVQSTLLTKLTISGSHEGPLLVTLGLSLLIVNVLLMIFGGRPLSVEVPVEGTVSIFGSVASWPRVLAFIGAAIVAVALKLVLERTPLGLSIRAVASNSEGAKLVGVDVGRVYAFTFGIGAACVAVAGGLMTPFTSLTPSVGEQFTILAFVIVVLGGLGSVIGAVVGGLVIGLVQTVGAIYLPGTGSLILVFAVFILVLFLRPEGLYGVRR
ncbi:ABC transporter permease [Rhodococcus sp. WMMA185]|nr:ABC transporter permease [Rhodococcus sp. WMMA185]